MENLRAGEPEHLEARGTEELRCRRFQEPANQQVLETEESRSQRAPEPGKPEGRNNRE